MNRFIAQLVPLSLRVGARRNLRSVSNRIFKLPFALDHLASDHHSYNHLVFEHQNTITKKWDGANQRLQEGKRTNIQLACPFFHRLLIRHGEIFSFYRQLGNPSIVRGFQSGYEVTGQGLGEGVGGGLCQLASSIFWIMLHAGFDIRERHHHDFDLFPDQDRQVPFGTGVSVFYNYHDLRMENITGINVVLSVEVRDNTLSVGLYSEKAWPVLFSVEERNHRFVKDVSGTVYRQNEIVLLRREGPVLTETPLWKNHARVLYPIHF